MRFSGSVRVLYYKNDVLVHSAHFSSRQSVFHCHLFISLALCTIFIKLCMNDPRKYTLK